MNNLWAPWRSQYIQTFADEAKDDECVFCTAANSEDDDNHYVVTRHEHCFAMLNLYPYNSGHLLLIPYLHTSSYHELTDDAYRELTGIVRPWLSTLDKVMKPQGYNFGSNIGRVGGAGIDQHIHMHIVPRWAGDANFMPVIGDTKVISENLHETMVKLREAFVLL
ncbi:MAG: HIT family hydrolase [Ectothiorhodospiraceae bacterium]|nr:HIT family hydrolase [Ectothiorhodospiraceae bacterium]